MLVVLHNSHSASHSLSHGWSHGTHAQKLVFRHPYLTWDPPRSKVYRTTTNLFKLKLNNFNFKLKTRSSYIHINIYDTVAFLQALPTVTASCSIPSFSSTALLKSVQNSVFQEHMSTICIKISDLLLDTCHKTRCSISVQNNNMQCSEENCRIQFACTFQSGAALRISI